jgi:hypothetical protein
MQIDMDFKMIGPGTYQKWNPKTLVRTTVKFDGDLMHVRHEQPKWVQDTILEDNVARQNSFGGYGNADSFHGMRAPMPVWQQIMKRCGFKQGQGYDEKKLKQIVNDSDYSKLKVVPGKI